MITYLTQLLGLPVLDSSGKKIGKVVDVIARQEGRLPMIKAIFIKLRDQEGWFPYESVELTQDSMKFKFPIESIVGYSPQDIDLRMERDILDKQIVDVHDYRVVRVNDVRIAQFSDNYCVVGADASLRAIVRRLPGGKTFEKLAKAVNKPLHSKLIAWDDVETMEPGAAGGGRIRLKVSAEKIARLHPADIADIIEQLDPRQRAQVIGDLDVETAADTIQEMDEVDAAAVMEVLDEERAADILEEMEPDDAADLLADLSDARSEDLLEAMEPEDAADVKELLAYGEDSAGGIMTTEYISIHAKMTCDETIKHLRELAPKAAAIYYVYVVDDEDRLVGVISLRDLIISDPQSYIADIMSQNVRYVFTSDHSDEVAHIVNRYNLLALPVVDDEHKLAGIIMVDDVMDMFVGPEKRRKLPQVSVDNE